MLPPKKICGWCGKEKTSDRFQVRKKKNGYQWLRLECKDCQNLLRKEKYKKDPSVILERNKKYYTEHRDERKEYKKKWTKINHEEIKEGKKLRYIKKSEEIKNKRKEYYYANKEMVIALNKDYVKRNLDKVRCRQRVLHNKKKDCDVEYIIKRRLRGRVRAALAKKATKSAGTAKLVGCSISFLRCHLEGLFVEGMGWHNMATWHIDHIKPCASFDLTIKEEQFKCFNWQNLQPLWGEDNLKKGAKYD